MKKFTFAALMIILAMIIAVGCAKKPVQAAKAGDTVKIHYVGTLDDGSVFDSSREREPFQFKLGSGQVIPGFDAGVTGMVVGEKKTIKIPADQAYGAAKDDLIIVKPVSEFKDDGVPDIGQRMRTSTSDGRTIMAVVKEVNDSTVTLDGNHPMAGKDLTFELELLEIIAG